ncbi:9569_t:CDS:2 [Ambispora gerdemannii]|uniref:9569_t:CDS:1 n=1 Tax=Ambispora gerdemannii TaxID=144530 RepID=A0A9N9H0T3_9GLOM|nr:9569_t:CDS:2 [Ambispora gerdemannii]
MTDNLAYQIEGTVITDQGYEISLRLKLRHFPDKGWPDFPEGYQFSFWQAVDTGKKSIQPKNVMVAHQLGTIYRVASPTRLDLLACVAEKQPTNLQELAKLLGRDYANV